jgi:hypothetical protein
VTEKQHQHQQLTQDPPLHETNAQGWVTQVNC